MIKDILQQLAPLDEKIAALRGDPADENMTDITNHAAELAELSAQEDALLSGCGALTAEDRVFLARHPERPHIDEIVDALFTDFFEQCGDRQCKEDAAILGGVALFHGQPVTVIGHRKGSTLEENLRCNFGMPGPEGYRKAFCNFDAGKVARMTDDDVERLMHFDGIVKNRLKIKATITNARLFLAVQEEFGSFRDYTLSFFPGGKPITNHFRSLNEIPASSPESDAMSRDMKKRGFKFFGPTICYAHLQASGFVNDHLTGCICRNGQ